MQSFIPLNRLLPGEKGSVVQILPQCPISRRLMDIGLIENETVTCQMRSFSGDPAAYLIRGSLFAIRNEDAAKILVKTRREGALWD